MQISLSAGGTPAQVKAGLARSASEQLGTNAPRAQIAAVTSMIDVVAADLESRGAKENDSVSASIYASVSISHYPAPEPGPTSAPVGSNG